MEPVYAEPCVHRMDSQRNSMIPRLRWVAVWRNLTKALALSALALAVTGCSVHDNKRGDAENVQLRTPLGALNVRTNAIHASDIGLPAYPGAVETGQNGNDSGSADVNMSFGSWSLHVKAISYRSSDSEDKIVAFYKNAMAKYGDVLTCKDKTAIGEPTRTQQGLTCHSGHEYHMDLKIDARDGSAKSASSANNGDLTGHVELLAGSPTDQHIVELNPDSGGTKFALVAVHLPHKGQTD